MAAARLDPSEPRVGVTGCGVDPPLQDVARVEERPWDPVRLALRTVHARSCRTTRAALRPVAMTDLARSRSTAAGLSQSGRIAGG